MEPPKSLQFLIKRCSRGRIAFQVIWISAIVCAAAFLFVSECRAWSAVAFLIAVMSALGMNHVRNRQSLAFRLLAQPNQVYWVQPRAAVSNLAARVLSGKEVLRLFLADGDYLEIEVPTDELGDFKKWVSDNNPQASWQAKKL